MAGVALFTMIGTAVVATALAGALYHGLEEAGPALVGGASAALGDRRR